MQNIRISSLSFTIGLACLLSLPIEAEEKQKPNSSVTIIQPTKKVDKVTPLAIDTEKFELGLFLGMLSVEDFATNPSQGISFTYHIDSKFIAQLDYGISDVGRATFEDVIGGDFLSNSDEKFEYIQVQAGYQIFHGRSFLSSKSKYNSHLYLMGGIESVQFAGNSEVGLILGTSYKIVLTDWLTWNISLRDHIFKREFISDSKITNNIEMTVGFNALF